MMNDYKALLDEAIAAYDFPCKAYDFMKGEQITFSSYKELETHIGQQLRSDDLRVLKDGLSNVLYWGYLTSNGRRDARVQAFRSSVTEAALRRFRALIGSGDESLLALATCKLPQFSNLSFLSKVLMFLDPMRCVTLDLQLARLKQSDRPTFFRELVTRSTSLPATRHNATFYERWCDFCAKLAELRAPQRLRAADIERAFFHLVKARGADVAAAVLAYHSQLVPALESQVSLRIKGGAK